MKKILKPITPQFLKNWRWKRIADRHRELAGKLSRVCSLTVMSGPFEGMKYIDSASGSMLGPKLLGTYELEIVEPVESIIRLEYDVIVDVGAAEGYYAVGFLYRTKKTKVLAYDTNSSTHELLYKLATINQVKDRIRISSTFDPGTLNDLFLDFETANVAIVMDIDGGEIEFLDPVRFPILTRCDLLVETHDCFVPGTKAALIDRFQTSHEVCCFHPHRRVLSELPELDDFSNGDQLELANEHRPPHDWLWMTRKR